jgi:hypothetical protein
LAEARSLDDLRRIEPKARQVYRRYMDELDAVDVKEMAIHRRISKLNYFAQGMLRLRLYRLI